MAQRKTLTEQQLELLQWVADGCPDGRYEGTHHRISAAALRSRGLISVSGRGTAWKATITAAGTTYLQRSAGPNPPMPRQPNMSVTAQLVADVIAAGGSLRLPRRRWGYPRDVADFERRAILANQNGRVPDGKELTVTHLSGDELKIDLVDAPTGRPGPATEVPIPETVGKYHPVVRAFRDATDCHEISRHLLPRALLLLQALVVEAERRGMAVKSAVAAKDQRGWSGPKHGHLTLRLDDSTVELRLIEDGLTSRVHWEGQVHSWAYRQEHSGRPTRADYEAKGTSKLRIEILTYNRGPSRQARWTDSRKGTVEQRLGEILREVELRVVERRERKDQAEDEAAAALVAWDKAVEAAKAKVVEAKRAEVLDGQVRQWHLAQGIRAYCDAVAAEYPRHDASLEWMSWARAYADIINPLSSPPTMPPPPEHISGEDLRPYLRGFDPYRPPEVRFVG